MNPSRVMTDRQFLALVRVLSASRAWTAQRDRFLFYFLGRTGLRISEALALRVRDFYLDVDPPFVRVLTLKSRRTTKGTAFRPSTDEVYLDVETARRARAYLNTTIPAYRSPASHKPAPVDAAVFPSLKLRPGQRQRSFDAMTRRNAHKVFKTWARRAGLPAALTLHSFRHYRATTLLRRTGDLELTRHQLRHRDIRNTQVYQHVDPDLIRKQLERATRDE